MAHSFFGHWEHLCHIRYLFSAGSLMRTFTSVKGVSWFLRWHKHLNPASIIPSAGFWDYIRLARKYPTLTRNAVLTYVYGAASHMLDNDALFQRFHTISKVTSHMWLDNTIGRYGLCISLPSHLCPVNSKNVNISIIFFNFKQTI